MNISKLIKLKQLREAKVNKSLIPELPDTTDPKELLQWIARVSAIAAVSPNEIDKQALNTCLKTVKIMLPKQVSELDALHVLTFAGWIPVRVAEEIFNGINDLELRVREALQSPKDASSTTSNNE